MCLRPQSVVAPSVNAYDAWCCLQVKLCEHLRGFTIRCCVNPHYLYLWVALCVGEQTWWAAGGRDLIGQSLVSVPTLSYVSSSIRCLKPVKHVHDGGHHVQDAVHRHLLDISCRRLCPSSSTHTLVIVTDITTLCMYCAWQKPLALVLRFGIHCHTAVDLLSSSELLGIFWKLIYLTRHTVNMNTWPVYGYVPLGAVRVHFDWLTGLVCTFFCTGKYSHAKIHQSCGHWYDKLGDINVLYS